jgi:hypothetical protein
MKTEELLRALTADEVKRWPSLEHLLMAGLLAGTFCAALLFIWRIGVRPNLLVAATDPRLMLKFMVTLALAVSAAGLLLRLIHPGLYPGRWALALLIGPVALAIGIACELIVFPPAAWGARLLGRYSAFCLTSVPLLAAPILTALLLVLRKGAPTRPALTGAVAGLLAGAMGAFLYAAHCPDDSPLFVLAWYGLSIALVTAVGLALGSRLLRW